VKSLYSAVNAVLAPELATFDAKLGVGVGDDLAAACTADYLDSAHPMAGLVELVLLNFRVTYVQDHVA